MKISNLVRQLNVIADEFGDLEVLYDPGDIDSIDVVTSDDLDVGSYVVLKEDEV